MSEKRPRISAETLDRLSVIVGTIEEEAVEGSVEHQVRTLTEAYVRAARERQQLAGRLRVLEEHHKANTPFSSSRSSASGQSVRGRRR
jgi:hypothetical protein